ncbi:substrate-binding domain-containing protein [Nocardioides sp.]|uniref:substrate-binding domain-containing protein n=1 Tax=Nocardioides sp. TaxID=35761 RepID=UPI002625D16F|nr:substrate-binding domain-containing protein [Nocardioides sp.]MDI6909359.1 substrate-binding domain-containing protein [Nocardioides sp.]
MPHKPLRLLAAIAVAAPLTLAGCSAPESKTSVTEQDATSEIAVAMNELIEQHSDAPEFTPPGPTFDASQLKGKTIAIVAIDLRVPTLADVVANAKVAAGLLGLKVTVFDAKSQATLMQQGMQQAIDNRADAIISDGLVMQVVADQIKEAKDRGIPTIDVVNSPPVPDVPGQGSDPNIFGNVSPDAALGGQLIAAAAIASTDGKAKVQVMNTSELTAAPAIVKSITETIENCDACEVVSTTDTALNDWSTQIPGLTATQIRSNPEINFILPIYDAMGIFATTGVQQAAATGKAWVASQDGSPAALALVKQGDVFVANVAKSSSWAAWAAVDQAMRGMLEMAPADPVLPVRYVDSAALEGVDTSTSKSVDEALFGPAYQDGYKELWGLS